MNAMGRAGQIGMQDAVELVERLLVKRDVIELLRGNAACAQAVVDGVARVSLVMFLAREALLLRGGDNGAITHEARRAVMVVRGEPENVYAFAGHKAE